MHGRRPHTGCRFSTCCRASNTTAHSSGCFVANSSNRVHTGRSAANVLALTSPSSSVNDLTCCYPSRACESGFSEKISFDASIHKRVKTASAKVAFDPGGGGVLGSAFGAESTSSPSPISRNPKQMSQNPTNPQTQKPTNPQSTHKLTNPQTHKLTNPTNPQSTHKPTNPQTHKPTTHKLTNPQTHKLTTHKPTINQHTRNQPTNPAKLT